MSVSACIKALQELADSLPQGHWEKGGVLRSIELLRIEFPPCEAILWAGPGHQSGLRCELEGEHAEHRSTLGVVREWEGMEAYE